LTLASLRGQIGLVPQETILFRGTLAENIALGAGREVTEDEIEAAARLANAHDFIAALPDGYDTDVAERGATLSAGQRQRIAIARAALRRCPILIFDEPTTGLDGDNEAIVTDAIWRLARGKTSLLITHDLSQAARADRIVFLDGGSVAEDGDHATLLARGGKYARLWALQQNRGGDDGGDPCCRRLTAPSARAIPACRAWTSSSTHRRWRRRSGFTLAPPTCATSRGSVAPPPSCTRRRRPRRLCLSPRPICGGSAPARMVERCLGVFLDAACIVVVPARLDRTSGAAALPRPRPSARNTCAGSLAEGRLLQGRDRIAALQARTPACRPDRQERRPRAALKITGRRFQWRADRRDGRRRPWRGAASRRQQRASRTRDLLGRGRVHLPRGWARTRCPLPSPRLAPRWQGCTPIRFAPPPRSCRPTTARAAAVAEDLRRSMPSCADDGKRIGAEVADRISRHSGLCADMVHGDFSADQVVINRERPIIIDWDHAACGDPARDIGTFLARLDAQAADGVLTRAEADELGAALVEGYARDRWRPSPQRVAASCPRPSAACVRGLPDAAAGLAGTRSGRWSSGLPRWSPDHREGAAIRRCPNSTRP
jgi:energy-coupling factor transporter ATP-binding protein EcfA2